MRIIGIPFVSIGLLAAAGALGCGAADQSTYAQCLREPRSYGDGATRTGHVTPYKMENDYSGYSSAEPGSFRTSITRKDCKDSLQVTGPGVDFRGGPWLPIWEEAFAANFKKGRLAFTYYEDKHRAFVWVDGKARGPYHDIAVSPRFSDSGEHVAYLVMEPFERFTLYIDDRRIEGHPRFTGWPFFYVLDDGKVASVRTEKRGNDYAYQVFVGDYQSPWLDQICSDGSFAVGPRGHWGFSGRVGGQWLTVIDGERVPVGGVPSRCDLKFSEDGQRSAYLSRAADGDPASKSGLVLDRALYPEMERAEEVVFQGSIAVVTLPDRRSFDVPGKVLVLAGLPTPKVPPSPDDIEPKPTGGSQSWTRVKIGDSVGPRVDVLLWKSLSVDPEGHVHYRAERGGATLDLVDNVVVKPAAQAVAR